MRAAWYDRNGAAREVLTVGELPDPEPGPGEVRVRLAAAGLNPADVKRRSGAGGRTMTAPRVVPGDDGAGTIDKIGPGVPADRVGRRVWVYAAGQHSPFGTSAEHVVVPDAQAVELPDAVPFDAGACLGFPALTAHRCLLADGPVDGATVLVTGGAGGVGHYAIQLAKNHGATVIATASTGEKRSAALASGADHVVDYRRTDAAETVLELTGGRGVDRVVDVAFGANLPLTSAVVATNGTIAGYASDAVPEPTLPFYPLMRRGIVVRMVLVYVMPEDALRSGVEDITELLAKDALRHPIAARHPLDEIAAAHEAVETGSGIGKIIIRP